MITRRSLIGGFASLLAAPAIVRASSIMPVKPWEDLALFAPDTTALARFAPEYITVKGYNVFTGEPFSMRMPLLWDDTQDAASAGWVAGEGPRGVTLPAGTVLTDIAGTIETMGLTILPNTNTPTNSI